MKHCEFNNKLLRRKEFHKMFDKFLETVDNQIVIMKIFIMKKMILNEKILYQKLF